MSMNLSPPAISNHVLSFISLDEGERRVKAAMSLIESAQSLSSKTMAYSSFIWMDLLRFLLLKVIHGDFGSPFKFLPPEILDDAWRALLLSPRLYTEICARLCDSSLGMVLDYDPLGRSTSKEQLQVRMQRYHAAYVAYAEYYGQNPPYYWPLCMECPICTETTTYDSTLACGQCKQRVCSACLARVSTCPFCLYPSAFDRGFQIFIKIITGRTVTMWTRPTMLVKEIKERVVQEIGTAADPDSVPTVPKIRLIYAGKELHSDDTVSFCNLQRECTIHQVVKLRGC